VALVDVYLGEAGEVLKVEAVEGESPLARALAEAIRGWRFSPAHRDGRPVAARLRVQHVFTS
jgi:hypothetical protein